MYNKNKSNIERTLNDINDTKPSINFTDKHNKIFQTVFSEAINNNRCTEDSLNHFIVFICRISECSRMLKYNITVHKILPLRKDNTGNQLFRHDNTPQGQTIIIFNIEETYSDRYYNT
jgi:hypothetical protein